MKILNPCLAYGEEFSVRKRFPFVIELTCIKMDDRESSEIVVDFGKICRLCLTDNAVFISLFPSDSFDSTKTSIPERIMDLMSIKVKKNDGFPSWICHNCLSQVEKCYEFFTMCRSSQVTLNESYLNALSEVGVEVLTLGGNEESIAQAIKQEPEEIMVYVKEEEVSKEEGTSRVEGEEREGKSYCSDCSKLFSSQDEFLIHRVSVHHDDLVTDSGKSEQESKGTSMWTCDPCGAKFRKRSALISHIQSKHLKLETERDGNEHQLKKLIFCKYCGLSFNRKNLGRHLEVVHKMLKSMETEQKNVDCRICFRPFMRHSSLRSHIEKFHGDNLEMIAEAENCEIVWNCSECDSVFLEEVQLLQHFGNKHSKYPFEMGALRGLKSRNLICGCGAICSNSFDAALHEIFYHSEESLKADWECPGCEKTFSGVDELKSHLVFYHWFTSMGYENECVFCNVKFSSNDSLRVHLNENHNSGKESVEVERKVEVSEEEKMGEPEGEETSLFVCQTCGELYKGQAELEAHGKECHPPHVCVFCGKELRTEMSLRRHVNQYHNDVAPIKCPLCPKVFPRKMNLHNHYKRRHLKQTKKFVCSYCGQSLKGKVALRSHEDRLHRNIRSYKCAECPEAFTTRSILLKHAQRHLSQRPMSQCKYCEKKFSTISGIERHLKTHEGVKDFTCDLPICGKSFYTKSELKRHMKYHTRDFKHVCPVCNHKFMSPGELKKHSTKHTGERPFKCHLCSNAYARRDDKVKHLKRVHNLRVKRIYGKPLRKFSDDDADLVDTIVIDEGSDENRT